MSDEKKHAEIKAKKDLLAYLMTVAQKTQGAEVWRALFSEIWARVEESDDDRDV